MHAGLVIIYGAAGIWAALGATSDPSGENNPDEPENHDEKTLARFSLHNDHHPSADQCAGDAIFKKVFLNVARKRIEFMKVLLAHQNDTNPGFYLQMIQEFGASMILVQKLKPGETVPDCWHIVTRRLALFDYSIAHRKDKVVGKRPYTGEAFYQHTLLNLGQAFGDVIEVANRTFHPTTKYQAAVRRYGDTVNAPNGMRAVIASKDNGPNCVVQLVRLMGDIQNQNSALTDKTNDCSLASLWAPYVEVPPHNCTITPIGCVGTCDQHADDACVLTVEVPPI